ncbi:LysR family transcriptional regulator [Thalassomonas viridans]|uniref:LysR family transcriptional regulator n=1 Tax=Thalassomonas viridans TaxID=137584 RepID=A0AAE9Z4B9_9GAMM|nr:LysR family transcriptional regulator [Thalassomonas viridans]WDE06067.1 LysR family transcriptional regulator [Thalassomonas viridans]
MKLKAMTIFCKVVEKGVMAHAAEELNITPAAVSKVISELEESLGTRLLNRTTRKLILTPAGVKYYESSNHILNQIEDLHDHFFDMSNELKGELKITAPISYGLTDFPQIVAGFQSLHPQISVSVHLHDAVLDLIENNYDLAIRIQREMKNSSLIAKAFDTFDHYIVCSKSYYAKHGPINDHEALKAHNCLANSNSLTPNTWHLNKDRQQYTHKFVTNTQINSSNLIKQLALKDMGICLLPKFLIEEELKSGAMVQLLPDYRLKQATGWIVYPGKKFKRPIVNEFIDYFLKETSARKSYKGREAPVIPEPKWA